MFKKTIDKLQENQEDLWKQPHFLIRYLAREIRKVAAVAAETAVMPRPRPRKSRKVAANTEQATDEDESQLGGHIPTIGFCDICKLFKNKAVRFRRMQDKNVCAQCYPNRCSNCFSKQTQKNFKKGLCSVCYRQSLRDEDEDTGGG